VFRLPRERFKLRSKDKPRVNLKHLAYYILAWVVYIDDIYKIYKALKVKYKKYLVRMYWMQNKQ
jgi:hypothetical protein